MKTLTDLLDAVAGVPTGDLVRERDGDGFRSIGSAELVARIERCAAGLAGLSVGRGDRVGLIASNRPDWHVVDFATHRRGGVLVPLFGNLTPRQVGHILDDSGASVVVVEGDAQLSKVAAVWDRLPALRSVVLLEPPEIGALGSSDPTTVTAEQVLGGEVDLPGTVLGWESWLADLAPRDDHPGPEGPDAVATLIYTSGTTGDPKGVMLTHDNLMSNVRALLEVVAPRRDDLALSVLPLCHVFERTVDYSYLAGGTTIAYGSPKRLAEDFEAVRPTCMAGVPRLYEEFRGAVLERVGGGGKLARKLFEWASRLGRRRARHELAGDRLGPLDRLLHPVADALVLRKIRDGAGGRVRFLVSGGAALDPDLNWWFEAAGMRLVQGYGLTESSPVIAVNPLDANRIGTVGPPIPGVEVEIAGDGEILTRGPHVMAGYWNDPEASAEAVEGGWLKTGDVGSLDDDGYLRVTDRKKHLIVTSTGKNVAPQPLENALSASRYIDQVCVVGDDRPFIAALIVPRFSLVEDWARSRGLRVDRDELCNAPAVIELIEGEVERLQAEFARYERIKAFRLLDEPFSIEEGTLTPTLKVVRREVLERHAGLVDAIYREHPAKRRST